MQTLASTPSTAAPGLLDLVFGPRRRPHPAVAAAGAVAVVAGLVLRFWTPSALWLDEALSVNIARLPLVRIPAALSHDGAPPLYYVLLHFWMRAFGTGDFAVRSLSGLTSVVTLPFMWLAGRRVGGRRVAWVAFFLLLSSPFAIEYATTTRMYSLMVLLSVLGFLAFARAWENPSRGRLAALSVVTAAILYTHYWGLYLVAMTGALVLWHIRRTGRGRPVFKSLALGVAAWMPWSPVFAFQALHTGTPWTSPAGPGDLLQVFSDFSGGGSWGALIMFATFALFVAGVFGRPAPAPAGGSPARAGVLIELRPRPAMAPLVAVTVGTLLLAVVLGAAAGAAFVARYTAVVLPLFVLVCSAGLALLPGARLRGGFLAVLVLAGLLTGQSENAAPRTQAVQVAAVLNAQARPGDLVVYCPDQLGPAVNRLLTVPGVQQITFPRAIGPERVDWVDYKKVIASTDVSQFAQDAIDRLPAGRTLWLVWNNDYAGFGGDCGYLKSWLDLFRAPGVTLVGANGRYYENENLTRYAG
ncbi:MAG TPA: glycosyltransferase family 39 protein [Acidimicrobiales bacterium]|nr:glycosyltransferase family 39 protein [Acidimicrobiales bacterium]